MPLYQHLKAKAKENPLRLHIPGHKGKTLPYMRNLVPLDFTELSFTGNLYENTPPFEETQQLWAQEFGFPHCQFITGGSTQGVYTALALCCEKGGTLLLDRGAHRSAEHGCGLLGIQPQYITRPWLKDLELPGPVEAEEVERILTAHPEIETVFITSPTVCGILADVYAIAEVVHEHGGKLIVDGAHGAHLPWLMIDNYSAADVVCVSAHKTLPVLGQGAMIFYRDFSPKEVGFIASLFGTASPSYAILSTMDMAREWMNGDGMMEYVRAARQVATLREIFPCLTFPHYLDPTRLTLLCHEGNQVAVELEKQGIYLEMANRGHLVAVFTAMDTDEEIQCFAKAVLPHFKNRKPLPDLSPPTTLPKHRMDIQDVILAKKITVPLKESLGKICGSTIAPFPPGVPVVVMGEEIGQEELDYLEKIAYQGDEVLIVAE